MVNGSLRHRVPLLSSRSRSTANQVDEGSDHAALDRGVHSRGTSVPGYYISRRTYVPRLHVAAGAAHLAGAQAGSVAEVAGARHGRGRSGLPGNGARSRENKVMGGHCRQRGKQTSSHRPIPPSNTVSGGVGNRASPPRFLVDNKRKFLFELQVSSAKITPWNTCKDCEAGTS